MTHDKYGKGVIRRCKTHETGQNTWSGDETVDMHPNRPDVDHRVVIESIEGQVAVKVRDGPRYHHDWLLAHRRPWPHHLWTSNWTRGDTGGSANHRDGANVARDVHHAV